MNLLFIYNQVSELSQIEQGLSLQGHKIYVVRNLNDALNTLSRVKIDLILCELVSENIDGIQILRRFKTNQSLSSIPFVLISSALTDDEDNMFFKKIGALGIIEKPITGKRVLEVIDNLINNPHLGFDSSRKAISDEEFFEEYSNILTRRIQKRVRDLESDQLFIRNLIDSIPSAIVLIDRDFRIYDINEAALKYIGQSDKEAVRGKNCYSVLYGSSTVCNFEGHRCPILAVIQDRISTEHFLKIDLNGETKFLNIHFSPILNPQSNTIMLLENIYDNTGTFNLIEKMRESELKLEAILNESRYGVILLEGDEVLIFNPPAMQLLGVDKRSLVDIRNAIGDETFYELVDVINQNVVFRKEITLPSEKSLKVIVCEAQRVSYKERNFVLIVLYDYTENYRLIQRIRESEQLLRMILNNIQDIFILIHNNKIVEISNQIENILGKKRELLIRQDVFSAIPFIKESFLIDTSDKEFEFTSREGMKRDGLLRIYPLNIGSERYVLLHITDVTEQRERERMRQVELSRMQYLDKLDMANKMINGITHNINNILTGINNFAEYLIKSEQDYEKTRATADIIKRLSRNAANIINRVSNLMKIEQREYRPLDIQVVIDELVELMRDSFPRNIQVEVLRDSKDNIVDGDYNSIFQALLNILINAQEAMPDGGRITISTKNIKERNQQGEEREYIQIAISDTGIGIDDEIKGNIFAPYFSSKSCAGAGLGLSIVYNTVQNHRGRIEFESTKGRGTTFIISLPLSEKRLEECRVSTSDEFCGNREKILIISENSLNRDILRRVLTKYNYEAYTAIDSVDGLESIRISKPDLIIMDSNLVRLSPVETFSQMRQISLNVPVILLTGLVMDEMTIELVSKGIDAIVYKPIDLKEVLSVVKSALNKNGDGGKKDDVPEGIPVKKRILIVDDEEYILAALKMNLSDSYDIQIETSATKALERILNNEEFHRFIIDINMPDMNGIEFYKMMKEVYSDLNKKVIFITGGITQESLMEELRGLKDEITLLPKPFDIEDIIRLL